MIETKHVQSVIKGKRTGVPGFAATIAMLMPGLPTMLITRDGEIIHGKHVYSRIVNGQVIFIEVRVGEATRSYLGNDLRLMMVNLDRTIRANIHATPTSSSLRLAKELYRGSKSVVYEQVRLPNTTRRGLMQLLNYGYDQQMKVFMDPQSRLVRYLKGKKVRVVGGVMNSYLVKKRNGRPVRITPTDFREQISRMLDEQMLAMDLRNWNYADLPNMFFMYDTLCREPVN